MNPGEDDDTFIDSVRLRKLFGGVSHMWAKRQMARDPSFPRPRYVNMYPYWRLGDLRVWWASLPTAPPPSATKAGVRGVEVLKEARHRKKAEAPPPQSSQPDGNPDPPSRASLPSEP
jgi:hypothetical protein